VAFSRARLVFLTIGVKLATAPIALLALLAIAVIDGRRSIATGLLAAAYTATWYVLTRRFLPWEWTWLHDQAALVTTSPIHHAPRLADAINLMHSFSDAMIISPAIAVVPAALVALVRRGTGRSRWTGAGLAIVALVLSVAPAYVQGEWFMYHYAIVPVAATAVVGAAFGLCPSARWPLAITTVVVAAASAILVHRPVPWRQTHPYPVADAYLIIAVIAAVVVGCVRTLPGLHPPRPRGVLALAATVACIAALPAVAPHSPYSFSTYDDVVRNAPSVPRFVGPPARLDEASAGIGHDTSVLYLAYGSIVYGMGNPAKYLVWQTDWFPMWLVDPRIKRIVYQQWNCSAGARIQVSPTIEICPRLVSSRPERI
jgi:hypothetical protein